MIGENLFMSTVFIAGFLSFFAPCIFPLLPVYIGIITDKENSKSLFKIGSYNVSLLPILRTFLFVGGLSTSFLILGFGAGFLGSFINGRFFMIISGLVVVVLGLHQIGILRITSLEKYKSFKINRTKKNDLLGTYLLGITFSFGWTPCVGPVLGAIIVVSAGGGSPFYGMWLMMIYALGLMIPFLIMALLSDYLIQKFLKVEKHLGTIKKIGGVLIVLMGIFLMTDNLNIITAFIEKLF